MTPRDQDEIMWRSIWVPHEPERYQFWLETIVCGFIALLLLTAWLLPKIYHL